MESVPQGKFRGFHEFCYNRKGFMSEKWHYSIKCNTTNFSAGIRIYLLYTKLSPMEYSPLILYLLLNISSLLYWVATVTVNKQYKWTRKTFSDMQAVLFLLKTWYCNIASCLKSCICIRTTSATKPCAQPVP